MKKRNKFAGYILILFIVGTLLGAGVQVAAASKDTAVKVIPENFSDLAERARPGVVNIRTVKKLKGGGPVFRHFFGNPFDDRNPFEDYFGPSPKGGPESDFKQQSLGSGFIIAREGYIVTNNHVIENADEIKVKLANGKAFNAEVVGRDPKTDLALIKIDGSNDLKPLPMGDSNALRVGTWVLAIGSPFGLEQTVTAGIVSAKGRVIGAGLYDDFIQTDASINPGNSGGPLLNTKGEVVGINTAIMSRGGGNDGVGFAIPVNLAKGIIEQLKNEGRVTRAWLGVGIQDLTPELADYYHVKEQKGALVTQVYEGDPAGKAGIKTGDIIVEVDGKKVSSSRDLSRTIASAPVGAQIPITILRDGQEKTFPVELTERVDSDAPAKVAAKGSNGLGLQVTELKPEQARRAGLPENEKGVLVTHVQPGGKGEMAGIQPGDVIKEVNRKPVTTPKEVKTQIDKVKSGDTVQMLIKRAQAGLIALKIPV
ncbi:MAG: DegQ family serine endoprotease [Deltaproteobacteria bacterium]|nr:MAG: DegQ family serine endoprotease [Deltaproteobacteria bacterium]